MSPEAPPRRRHSKLRKAALALTAASALAQSLALATPATAPAATFGNWELVGGNAFVGVSPNNLSTVESAVGRKLAIRVYYHLDSQIPSANDQRLESEGRMLVASIRTKINGTPVKYSTVINGSRDAILLTALRNLHNQTKPVFLAYEPEMDGDNSQASCSQPGNLTVCTSEFIAAYRHVYDLSKANGLNDRIFWMYTPTAWGFTNGANHRAEKYYPGNSYVDWIAPDVYNNSCASGTKGQAFADSQAKDVQEFANRVAPGKPVMSPEMGSSQDGSVGDWKAWFIGTVRATLKTTAWSNWRGVMWWDQDSACDFRITGTSQGMAAFKAMATDPYFLATSVRRLAAAPPPAPTTTSVKITSPASGATIKGVINVTASASDPDGINAVALRVDGNFIADDHTAAYAMPLDTRTLTTGKHTLVARMWDAKGNFTDSAAVTVNVVR